MTPLVHPQPGSELDWLAVDIQGHIGLFSTGGQGLVPRSVIDESTAVEAAIARLNGLPLIGGAMEAPENGDFSFWIEPARRGIYGYDWGPVAPGPYARLAVPSVPLGLDELSDSIIKAAALLVRLSIRFAATRYVDLEELQGTTTS